MARTIDDIYGKLEEIAKSLSSLNDTVEEVNGENGENDGDGTGNKKKDDK